MSFIGFNQIILIVTRKCPYACYYCQIKEPIISTDNDVPSKRKEVPLDTYIQFFDKISKIDDELPFITLIGGEPLYYPHIEELIDYFNEHNIAYTMETTGLGPNETLSKNCLTKARGVSTSLDFDRCTRKSKHCNDLLIDICKGRYGDPACKIHGIVGEVMITSANIDLALESADKLLSQYDHWMMDPIYIEKAWSKEYDFASDVQHYLLLSKHHWLKVIDFCQSHKDRILFVDENISFANMMANESPRLIPYCNPMHATTIDSDGSFRLCYRIKGDIGLSIDDFINMSPHDFFECYDAKAHYEKDTKCLGCFWQCPWFSMTMSSSQMGINRATL